MKISRLQTDYRLWFWSTLALFLSSWCFPIMPDKGGGTPIERVFWGVNWAFEGNMPFSGVIWGTITWAIFAAVVSSVLACFFQYGVVIVRTRQPKMFDRIANPGTLLYLGIAAAILIGMFPPWTYTSTVRIPGASLQDLRCSAGYSFVLTPPTVQAATFTIDRDRLVGQLVGVALVVMCGLLYFRQERRRITAP